MKFMVMLVGQFVCPPPQGQVVYHPPILRPVYVAPSPRVFPRTVVQQVVPSRQQPRSSAPLKTAQPVPVPPTQPVPSKTEQVTQKTTEKVAETTPLTRQDLRELVREEVQRALGRKHSSMIPSTTPLVPSTTPLVPSTTPLVPSTTPLVPSTTPLKTHPTPMVVPLTPKSAGTAPDILQVYRKKVDEIEVTLKSLKEQQDRIKDQQDKIINDLLNMRNSKQSSNEVVFPSKNENNSEVIFPRN